MRAGRDGDEKKMAGRLRGSAWYSRVGVERSRWENEDEGRYLCCRRRIGFGAQKGLNLKVPTPYNRPRALTRVLLVHVYERAFVFFFFFSCAQLCSRGSALRALRGSRSR